MSIPDSMDPIGIWLLKWVFILLTVLMILFMIVDVGSGQRKCAQVSEIRGYLESEYITPYRYSGGVCIMKKKKNADGTVDENAIMKVEMR
jgi:hypothetical protein